MQLRWQWARPMGQLLGQAWNRLGAPRPVGPTLWVPIPARPAALQARGFNQAAELARFAVPERSEEHTSELQSRGHIVCRLLLEKKKKYTRDVKLRKTLA